jgi:DNA-directed RNA polymerase I, II, and III subunit RPABC5
MPIPVRCFSCGKVVGTLEIRIEALLKEGKEFAEIFEILKLERYCCRRMVMSSVDLNEILLQYKPLPREDTKVST